MIVSLLNLCKHIIIEGVYSCIFVTLDAVYIGPGFEAAGNLAAEGVAVGRDNL